MKIFDLNKILNNQQICNLDKWLETCQWYENAPGGFVTNSPKRLVNAYGTGQAIDENKRLIGNYWSSTFWTAKMNASQISLETQSEPLPEALINIIPNIRNCFKETFSQAIITDYTFIIAVCNYYTDPDMYIAAHTDDNHWYPKEIADSPVFASLTFYPKGKPTNPSEYARFQIKKGDKWETVYLPDHSVCIMPSNIPHRVLPTIKKNRANFKPRINITLRSCYSFQSDPLRNLLVVSNHNRYYKLPSKLYIPNDSTTETLNLIIHTYTNFLAKYKKRLSFSIQSDGKTRREEKKRAYYDYNKWLKEKNRPSVSGATNIVLESLILVNKRLINLRV